MVSAEHWCICSAWQKTGVSAVSGGRLVYLCCLVGDSGYVGCGSVSVVRGVCSIEVGGGGAGGGL